MSRIGPEIGMRVLLRAGPYKKRFVLSIRNGFTWFKKHEGGSFTDLIPRTAATSLAAISAEPVTPSTTTHATSPYQGSLEQGSFR